MGTRNTTIVKLKGEIKVSQYGQWDGYPSGQGQTIADFLITLDDKKLEGFKEKVKNLEYFKESDLKEIENNPEYLIGANHDWTKTFPQLSRDTGAEILGGIEDGTITKVRIDDYYSSPDSWVEYVYTVDLDNKTVTIDGHSFDNEVFTFEEWITPDTIDALDKYDPDYYHDMSTEELEEHYTKIVQLSNHFPDYIQNIEKELESRSVTD